MLEPKVGFQFGFHILKCQLIFIGRTKLRTGLAFEIHLTLVWTYLVL